MNPNEFKDFHFLRKDLKIILRDICHQKSNVKTHGLKVDGKQFKVEFKGISF